MHAPPFSNQLSTKTFLFSIALGLSGHLVFYLTEIKSIILRALVIEKALKLTP